MAEEEDWSKYKVKSEPPSTNEFDQYKVKKKDGGDTTTEGQPSGSEAGTSPSPYTNIKDNTPANDGLEVMGATLKRPEEKATETQLKQESQKLTAQNKNLDFVKRALNPDNSPRINNPDGTFSTHKLAYDVDRKTGEAIVYPTIVNKNGKLVELGPDEAYDYAKKTKEYIVAPSAEVADYYSKNGLIDHTAPTGGNKAPTGYEWGKDTPTTKGVIAPEVGGEDYRAKEDAKQKKRDEDVKRQADYLSDITINNPQAFSTYDSREHLKEVLKAKGYDQPAIDAAISHGQEAYETSQLKQVDKTEEFLAKKLLTQFGVDTKDDSEVHQKVVEARKDFGLSLLGEDSKKVFDINEKMRAIAGKPEKSAEDFTKWGQLNEERKQLGALQPLYDMNTGAIVEKPTPEQIQDNKEIDARANELKTSFKDRLGQVYNNAYLRYQYYNQKFTPDMRDATLPGAATSSDAPFNPYGSKYDEAEELRGKWLDAKKELYAASRAYLLNEDPGAAPRGITNDLKLVAQAAARTAIPQSLFLGDDVNQTNQDLIDGYHMLASRNSIPLNKTQSERMAKTIDEQIAEGTGGILGLVPYLVLSRNVVGAASKALGIEQTIASMAESNSTLNNMKAFVLKAAEEGLVTKGAGMSASSGVGFGVANQLTQGLSASLPGKLGTIVAPILNKLMIAPASATAAMQVANLSESAVETLLTDKTFQDALKEHGYGDLDQSEKKLLVDYIVNTLYSGMSVRPKDFKGTEYRALANELESNGKKEDANMIRGWVDNMGSSDMSLGDHGLAQREGAAQGEPKSTTSTKETPATTTSTPVVPPTEVNLPEPPLIDHPKLILNDGETVNYQGIEGTVVNKDDGVYVRDYDGTDHIIESGQSGATPADLGIKIMPPQTPVAVQRPLSTREQNGEATYANKKYFVSLMDPEKPDSVGDKVYEINPDGTYTERFVGKSKANRDGKLAIINKYLKGKGLPRKGTVFGKNAEPHVNEKMEAVHAEVAKEEQDQSESIANLADRISKGEKITSPEDLQLQANHPKELENELGKIKSKAEAPQPVTDPIEQESEPVKQDISEPVKTEPNEKVDGEASKKADEAQGRQELLTEEKGVKEVTPASTAPEITPNKGVKANQKIAIDEIAENRGIDKNAAAYVHQLAKKGVEFEEPQEGIAKSFFKKAEDAGLIEYAGDQMYKVSEEGQSLHDAVESRLSTRKGVKAGTDMFPDEANIPELKKELKTKNVSDESITRFENRPEHEVQKLEPAVEAIEAKGQHLQDNADSLSPEEFDRQKSDLLSEIDQHLAKEHDLVKRVTFTHAGSEVKGTVVQENYKGATGMDFKYQVKADNGRLYPINEKDIVSENYGEKSLADKIRDKKIDTSGKALDVTAGLPIAVWNGAVEVIATAIEAGHELNKAFKKGMAYVKRELKDDEEGRANFKEQQFKDYFGYVNKDLLDAKAKIDLAKQMRTATSQGMKEGAKFEKAFQDNVSKLIADALKGKRLPPLTERQMKALINSARRIRTPFGVSKYIDFVNKVISDRQYVENLKEGKSLRGKLRTSLRSKEMLANDTNTIKDFLRVNPSEADEIAEYNDIAKRLLESTKPLKGTMKGGEPNLQNTERTITNEQVDNYVQDHLDLMEEQNKAKLAADYQYLVDAGIIDPSTMTYKQMQELTKAIDAGDEAFEESTSTLSPGEISERERAMRTYMDFKVEAFKDFMDEQRFPLGDGTLKSIASPREKQTMEALASIDLDRLDLKDLVQMNNVINNIQTNGDFSGAGQFEVIKKKHDYLDKVQSLLDEATANGLKLGKLGGGRVRDVKNALNSIDLMYDELAQDDKLASKMQLYTGSAEVQNASTRTNVRQKELLDGYQALLKEHAADHVNTAESIFRRGVFSYAIQHHGEETMQEDFDRQKSLVKQSYEKLLQSDNERERKEGLLAEKAYNELLDGSETAADAEAKYEAMDPSGKLIADYFKDQWGNVVDDYEENTMLYHNKGFERVNEFTAQRISKMYGSGKMDSMAPDASNFSQLAKGPSSSTITRARINNLAKTKKIDFNFDRVQTEAYREAIFDIENAKNVKVMDAVMGSPELRKMLGGENAKVLRDAADRMVRLQSGKIQSVEPYVKAINKALNVVTAKSVRLALGGVSQVGKQYLSVASNAALYLGNDLPLFFTALSLPNDMELFNHFPIGDREGTVAGASKQVDLSLANDANLGSVLNKTFEGLSESGEKASHLILKPLTSSDKSVARTSWLAYYMKSLKDQGIDITPYVDERKAETWAKEHENPNLEAAAYAEQVVSKTQHVNSTAKGALLMTSQQSNGFDILKNMFLPFSSFGVNQRVRMTNDIKRIMHGGNKTEAFKDLGATLAETVVFNALKVYAIGALTTGGANMILSALGAPPKKEDDKFKKFYSQTYKDYFMNGMGALPEHLMVNGTNQLGKLFGADKDVIYNYKNAPGDPDYSPWGTYGVLPGRINDLANDTKYIGNTTTAYYPNDYTEQEEMTPSEKAYYRTMFFLEAASVLGASDADLFSTLEKAKRQMNKNMESKYGGPSVMEITKNAKGEYLEPAE